MKNVSTRSAVAVNSAVSPVGQSTTNQTAGKEERRRFSKSFKFNIALAAIICNYDRFVADDIAYMEYGIDIDEKLVSKWKRKLLREMPGIAKMSKGFLSAMSLQAESMAKEEIRREEQHERDFNEVSDALDYAYADAAKLRRELAKYKKPEFKMIGVEEAKYTDLLIQLMAMGWEVETMKK